MSQKHKQIPKKQYKIPTPRVDIPESKTRYPIKVKESYLNQLIERSKDKLVFSFEFFDRTQDEFNLGGASRACDNWFIGLLDILKDVSSITRNELVVQKRNFYDAHGYKWSKLKVRFPFPDDFLEQAEFLQFRLSKSKGRVHGFIVEGNKFYIVWLDPHHNLYPDDKYGGLKYYDAPKTCADYLQGEVFKLMEENGILQEENNKLRKDYENLLNYITSP